MGRTGQKKNDYQIIRLKTSRPSRFKNPGRSFYIALSNQLSVFSHSNHFTIKKVNTPIPQLSNTLFIDQCSLIIDNTPLFQYSTIPLLHKTNFFLRVLESLRQKINSKQNQFLLMFLYRIYYLSQSTSIHILPYPDD